MQTHRQLLAARAHRAEIEAEERAAEEARMAPIRAAEAQMNATASQLAKVYRARLLAETRDPELYVAPELSGVSMTRKQADEYLSKQAVLYFRDHPEEFSSELAEMLNRYWKRNGIELFTSAMLGIVVARFKDAGLLPERPEPELAPEALPEPTPIEQHGPKTYIGRDWLTGQDREFSEREVNRMSSTEYRRAFKICQSVGELFTIIKNERERQ